MLKYVLAAGAAALLAGSAQATVFTVSGVFQSEAGAPAGTLFGSLTTSDNGLAVTDFDLTASAFGTFAGFRYTPTSSAPQFSFSLPFGFEVDSIAPLNRLQLAFSSLLTDAGATLNPAFSLEIEPSGGFRNLMGTVVPHAASVPELASWAMMIAGFGAVGFAMRRRQSIRVTFA